jgi:hypothetical protein
MDGRGRAMDNIFNERLWRSVKYEKYTSTIMTLFMMLKKELADI